MVTVVTAVWSNPSLGTFPKINISFFLLSACTEQLLGTRNITKFLPNLTPLDNEKAEYASNSVPYPK